MDEDIWSKTEVYSDGQGQYKSEAIILTPGVYQVQVTADPEFDEGMLFVTVMDSGENGMIANNALRCSGGVVSGENANLEFEVYVADTIETNVVCEASEIMLFMVNNITLHKTNMGSRILCFGCALLIVVIHGLVELRKCYIGKKIENSSIVAWCMMVGCVLITFYPYMTNYLSDAGGVKDYLERIEILKDWITRGQGIRLTWKDFLLAVPVLFRMIGFPLMTAYKLYVFVAICVVSGIVYWSLRNCVEEQYVSVVAAVVYMLMPYHMYNLYECGDVNVYISSGFLVLTVSAFIQLISRQDAVIKRKGCGTSQKAFTGLMFAVLFGFGGMVSEWTTLFLSWTISIIPFAVVYGISRASKLIKREYVTAIMLIAAMLSCFAAMYYANTIAYESFPIWIYG